MVITAGAQTGDTLTDDGISSPAGGIVPGTAGIFAAFFGDTLTLSGTDTVANYNIALEEVKFNATNPHSGARTLTWTVDDEAGGHINDGSATTTANAAFGPDLTAGPAVNSVEGSSTGTITVATFTDSTLTSPTVGDFTATINWGDTTSSTGTVVAEGGGVFAVTGAHTYVEEGSYPVGVTVIDTNNVSGSASDSATVTDAPLSAGNVTVTGGVEGVTAATLNATFSDGNTAAPASDFSGTVTWGDGTTSNFTSSNVTAFGNGAFSVSGLQHLYAEDGNDNVSVAIKDVGGSTTTDNGTARVADAPLAAGTITVTGAVEGVTAGTLSATFTDANTGASTSDFSGTIDWGDGSALTSFTSADVTGSNGNFTVNGLHLYAEEGSYSPIVHINDAGGSNTTDTGTTTVADAPLTAFGASWNTIEGTTLTATVATFTDANPNAPLSDFTATINWGDTTSSTGTITETAGVFTVTGTHTFALSGSYSPVVSITDVGGSTAKATDIATIADAPLATGTVTVTGGVENVTVATLSATFTDGNTIAPTSDFSGTIDWGDGSAITNFTSSNVTALGNGDFVVSGFQHLYAEEGTDNVSVTVNDVGGSTIIESGTTTVADAPLTAGTITVTGGVEGATAATLSATFTDANTAAQTSDFSGTIDWGDGSAITNFTSADVTGSNGNFTVSGSHLYAEEGTYHPTVTILDDGGSTATETGMTTVADAPLTASGTALNSTEGATLTATVATFTDANPNAPLSDFTATIDWGDSTSSTGTITETAGVFSVTGTHTYAEEGTYPAVVSITDVGGSTAQASDPATVVDAPLTAGTVTASGGVEGATVATLSATFTDANTNAPTTDFSGTIDWGDGSAITNFTSADVTGSNGNFAVSGSHLYAEEGTYHPTVMILDDGGSTATETGTTTVPDAPLTASGAGTTLISTEGTSLSTTVATFIDGNPNAPLSDFTATINWGDTTSSTATITETAGVFSVTGTHTYALSGVYTADVSIVDVGGSTATASDTVDAVPVAPAITTLVGKPLTNQTVELEGTGDVGDVVNLYADGNTTTIVGTGHVVAGGTFDVTTTATFGDGLHTFTATETDSASLTSLASTPAFPVTVVHEPPVVTAGTTVIYTQDGPAQALDIGATVTDPDSGNLLTGATVQIGAGFLPGDVLTADTTGLAITASYNAANGTLTLTGTDTLVDYTHVLDSITFLSTSPNPSNDGANLTRTISWSVTDGNPTNAISATVTSTVDVHAVPTVITGTETVVAGADVDFTAGQGKSVVLDPAISVFDGTSLTGATVSIASGFQSGETLGFDASNLTGTQINGTNITESYNSSTGVLTLTGKDTPQDYQAVLRSVSISASSAAQSGPATIDWQVTDQNNLTSKVATSTVEVTASLTPPPPHNPIFLNPDNIDHGHFGDFSGMLTNAQFGGTAGLNFGQGNAVYVIHSDVNPTVADNGSIGFDLALNQLDAALGGDVVSVTATLANGQPLPAWLAFNADTGQFAGLVPDDITGSIDHDGDGGFDGGQGGSELMTVQVIARDSRGNVAVTDFTIHFATPTQHKADRHGWNVLPGEKFVDPWGQVRQRGDFTFHSGLVPHRDVAASHAPDRTLDHVAWHVPAFDADRVHADSAVDHAPAGRAGFSDQIKTHGWHAVAAQRTALLDSLRQGVAGWR